MISNQTSLRNNIKLMDYFECEPCLKNDLWVFTESEVLIRNSKANQNQRKRRFDFSVIKNKTIRDEVKYFIAHQVMQGKEAPCINKQYLDYKRLFEYLSQKDFDNANSLLDYDKEELMKDYRTFLQGKNLAVIKGKGKINKDISRKIYIYNTDRVYILKRVYEFLYLEVVENSKKLFDREKWAFKELPFSVSLPDCAPNKSISFSKIVQPGIKIMVKKLCWYELTAKQAGTALVHVYSLNYFSKYLYKFYPNVIVIEDITCEILHNYVAYLKTESGLESKTIKDRIEVLDILLETIRAMKWAEVDPSVRIKKEDLVKTVDRVGQPYTDDEIKEINIHLDQMPIQIARLLCVLQYIGCRISEICSCRIEDLRTTETGEEYLHYRQIKTKKYNVIPIEGIVSDLLRAATKTSQEYHGDKAKYIFSLADKEIIKPYMIDNKLKELSYKWDLRDRSGKPLNIRTHRFRDTVATNYAELGIDPVAISRMLGQKCVGVLKHYVEIQNDVFMEAMQPIMDKQSELIRNIGHIEKVPKSNLEDSVAIPLPNGACYKPANSGLCLHANCCYNCKMFRPDPRHVNVYKYHLSKAKQNIDIAKIHGFDRLLQINKDLERSLIEIIKTVEGVKYV